MNQNFTKCNYINASIPYPIIYGDSTIPFFVGISMLASSTASSVVGASIGGYLRTNFGSIGVPILLSVTKNFTSYLAKTFLPASITTAYGSIFSDYADTMIKSGTDLTSIIIGYDMMMDGRKKGYEIGNVLGVPASIALPIGILLGLITDYGIVKLYNLDVIENNTLGPYRDTNNDIVNTTEEIAYLGEIGI
jgi:hypothetical protein